MRIGFSRDISPMATLERIEPRLKVRKPQRGMQTMGSCEVVDMNLPVIKLLGAILLTCVLTSVGGAQRLRDTFRRVKDTVVVVRTEQRGEDPALGSGVVISADGKVLTAAHVVQTADKISVQFADNQTSPARVIASSVLADVALIQLTEVPANAMFAKLGNSDEAEVGDEILVVGAPFGLSYTLTVGHISGRHLPGMKMGIMGRMATMEFFQTDAAINMGNSGGPMFNLNGEVIGIVSSILSRSGGFEGVGFAATSRIAQRLLLERNSFWSGLEGVLIDGPFAKALNLPQAAGFLVQRVAEGSPSWRQGIRAGTLRVSVEGTDVLIGGDIILEVNNIPFVDEDAFDRMSASLNNLKPGDKLTSKVMRAGQVIELSTTITAR